MGCIRKANGERKELTSRRSSSYSRLSSSSESDRRKIEEEIKTIPGASLNDNDRRAADCERALSEHRKDMGEYARYGREVRCRFAPRGAMAAFASAISAAVDSESDPSIAGPRSTLLSSWRLRPSTDTKKPRDNWRTSRTVVFRNRDNAKVDSVDVTRPELRDA